MKTVESQITDANDYVKLVINNEADKVLHVVFGSYGLRKGTFDFYGSANSLKKNVLFVNTPVNDWYTSPLPWLSSTSTHDSVKKFGSLVNQICTEHGFVKCIFLGFSMGGYGALLYSRASNIENPIDCIAVGTNIYLSMPKTVSSLYYDKLWPHPELHDLREVDFRGDSRRYMFVFGEIDVGDSCSALMFRDKLGDGCQLFGHIGSTHNMPAHLKNGVGLLYGLERLLAFDADLPGRGNFAHRFSTEDVEPLVHFSPGFVEAHEVEYLRKLLEKYPSYVLALNRIGAYELARGRTALSLEALKRAWELAPHHEDTNRHLSLVYEKTDAIELALCHAILAKNIFKTEVNIQRVQSLQHKVAAITLDS